MVRRAVLAAPVLLLSACAMSRVVHSPSGQNAKAVVRPPDCAVEFFRSKPPDRAYDELGALTFSVTQWGITGNPGPAEAQEAIRVEACALGADAVIVAREYLLGQMVGTAVRYR